MHHTRNRTLLGAVTALAMLSIAACGSDSTSDDDGATAETQTIRLNHKFATSHYIHEVSELIADRISEGTDGRITVDIYPAEQLIPEAEEIGNTESGAIHISMPSTSEWHDFDIPAAITGLPFIVNSFEESRELRGSEFERLYAEMMEGVVNIRVMGFLEAGGVNAFVTKDGPLASPDAFGGLRLRSNNAVTAALFDAYGSPGLSQAVSDVYTALERGTIDGAITTVAALDAAKWYEAASHVTLAPGWLGYAAYPMIVNLEWYDGLSADDKEAVDAAFAEAVEVGQTLVEEDYTAKVENFKTLAGVSVHEVPASDVDAWAQPGEFLVDEFLDQWGEQGQTLLDAYSAP